MLPHDPPYVADAFICPLAIGYPLFRLMPVAYSWINRRRLFYWYAQLKALEASFDTDPTDKHLTRKQAEIERIEDAVQPYPVSADLLRPGVQPAQPH